MSELNLTQNEADSLIAMEKHRSNEDRHTFPAGGQSLMLSLNSPDKRETFHLDISRGRMDLAKVKFQNRARQIIVLVRLDLAGAPHRNPDGEEVACPHLHLYREGFSDKWAVPIPPDRFPVTSDAWATMGHFMAYCNITEPPHIERGLFE
jgi:hypothetical protein